VLARRPALKQQSPVRVEKKRLKRPVPFPRGAVRGELAHRPGAAADVIDQFDQFFQ
jgi:hypothetical protein